MRNNGSVSTGLSVGSVIPKGSILLIFFLDKINGVLDAVRDVNV